MITHYQRFLPHILPAESTVFITFRLHGSLPTEVIEHLKEEKAWNEQRIKKQHLAEGQQQAAYKDAQKRYFAAFDDSLARYSEGNDWLKLPAIAQIVMDAIHFYAGSEYILHAYCIMPNHVHLLITILNDDKSFFLTLKTLKGFSARRCNQLLDRTGTPFWHPESYDHVVRDGPEFERIVAYILNNPVKAGLVDNWQDWPHTYLAE